MGNTIPKLVILISWVLIFLVLRKKTMATENTREKENRLNSFKA
jgi:hypothetical protein